MSAPGLLRRRTAAALVATATVALVAALPAQTSSAAPTKPAPGNTQLQVQMLSFNDFHGNLEPPQGSSGRVTTGYTETQVKDSSGNPVFNPDGTPKLQATATTKDAGGVAYLAAKLRELRAGHENSLTVAAGDLIGASPLLSAAFHDEPSIEALNQLGLDVSSVGNHEFDEGYRELQRMDAGGCLDDDDGENNQNSCPDGSFAGASFPFLAANVKYAGTDETVLPPYWVKNFNGAKIGFIGMTLKDTPTIVTQSGIAGLEFTDEVATANALVPVLREQGVKAIVVLLHQGGTPKRVSFTGPSGAVYTGLESPYDYTCQGGGTLADDSAVLPIAQGLDPEIDMVVSGHTHQPYVCNIPDPSGADRMVTSASSFGRLVTETSLTYDRRTQDIVRSSVEGSNVIVERKGTAAEAAPDLAALIQQYKTLVAPIANRRLGSITADVLRAPNSAGESQLGDLIADGQLAEPTVATPTKTPQIAFMNPGGIRTDLQYKQVITDGDAEGDGVVTYEEAFNVQPFNNFVVSMDMTGGQIYDLLEQQWTGLNSGTGAKVLQVSNGFSYRWNPAAAPGQRVIAGSVTLDGTAIPDDGSQTYRVVANNFLADGGDNFTVFKSATDKLIGGLDIDSFANYLEAHSPYTSAPLTRITTGTS